MQRREFLEIATAAGATVAFPNRPAAAVAPAEAAAAAGPPPRYEEWLTARHQRVIPAAHVEAFLQAPPNNQWARFDAELGYVPSDSIQRDGVDGSRSVYRYGAAGERKTINYADRPCRVNTYGNSYTQCHQVSDSETWQEHLAAR